MKTVWTSVICGSVIFILSQFAVGIAAAENSEAELRKDAQRRLNYSGRQRMLSQRISKTACLAKQVSDKEKLLKEMKAAYSLFYKSLKALREGSDEMELMPETDPDVLPLLDKSTKLANEYKTHADAVLGAFPETPKEENIETIYRLSLPLLLALDDVVVQLQAKHDEGSVVRPGLAHALNMSGRQRMLSQKMSKEVCMISLGHQPRVTRAHLMGTIALFQSSHEVLKQRLGPMKLTPEDEKRIAAQLELIETHWAKLSSIFTRVSTGGEPSQSDLETIATDSIKFLFELNRAVEMYEMVDISQVK